MTDLILEVPMAKVGLISDIVLNNTDEIAFKRLDGTELTDHKSLLEQACSLINEDEYLNEQPSVGVLNVNVLEDLACDMRVDEGAFLQRWIMNVLSAPRLSEVVSSIIDSCNETLFVDHVMHEQLLSELQEALSNVDVDALAYFYRVSPANGGFEFEFCAYYQKHKYVLFNGPASGFEGLVYREIQVLSIVDTLRAFCLAWEQEGRVNYSDKCYADMRQAYTGILASSPI